MCMPLLCTGAHALHIIHTHTRTHTHTHTHTPIAPPHTHKQDGKPEGGEEKKPQVKENKFLKLAASGE
jgi:hypothetical protein